MKNLEKKTILITGASSGIGKAAALLFYEQGWNVIATMRSPEKEKQLKNNESILLATLEVTNIETIKKAIQRGLEKFSKIDVLLNNAGYGDFGAFENMSSTQVEKLFKVNVYGYMNTIREILPHFRENGEGMIINISSQGGRITFPTSTLYHATKFAIEGFSDSTF